MTEPEKGQPLPGNIERIKEDSASPLAIGCPALC
jgi:hypothetical protein